MLEQWTLSQLQKFMKQLGLNPRIEAENLPEAFYQELASKGIYEHIFNNYKENNKKEHMNVVFISEKSGIYAINSDIKRIINLLMDLKEYFEKRRPQKILEVGGGTGIISMWLSKMLPESEFTVVDFSKNAMKLGLLWAEKIGCKKIRFIEMSYSEFLEKEEGNFDLILNNHNFEPIEMSGLGYKGNCFGNIEKFYEKGRIKNEDLLCLAKIVNKFLAPDGVALFTGIWTEPCMMDLLEALRAGAILPDWRYSHHRGTLGKDGISSLSKGLIAVSRGAKTLTQSAIEDQMAFWSMGDLALRNRQFSWGTTLQLARIFENCEPLFEMDLTFFTGGTHRLKITRRESCLFVKSITTLGFEVCFIYSVAEIESIFNYVIARFISISLDEESCYVSNYKIDQYFKEVLEFHGFDFNLTKK